MKKQTKISLDIIFLYKKFENIKKLICIMEVQTSGFYF